MKALNIQQPWAWLIANGHKTVETRTWLTRYRGPLLIVASKARLTKAREAAFRQRFPAADLVYGQAVAVAVLDGCSLMTAADEPAACCGCYGRAIAWKLSRIRKIAPFPVTGRLGLYEFRPQPTRIDANAKLSS